MKSFDVKSSTYIDFVKKNNKEDPKFKVNEFKKYQNIETFLQNVTFQIGLKKILRMQKLKILLCRHMLLVILMVNKLLERFTKKYLG